MITKLIIEILFNFEILEKLKMSKSNEEQIIHQNLSNSYNRDLSVNWEEDENGVERIVKLSLFSLNIEHLPNEIFKLEKLKKLNLGWNNLSNLDNRIINNLISTKISYKKG